MNGFTFCLPDGFSDATNYVYRARKPPEALSIITESPAAALGEQAPSFALTRIRRRVEHILGDGVVFEADGPVSISGRSGLSTAMMVRDVLHRIVAIMTPEDLVAIITYVTSAADPRGSMVFEHCLASLCFDATCVPPASGYSRAIAYSLSLDVPAYLSPPPVQLYLSRREHVRVRVTIAQSPTDPRAAFADEIGRGARVEQSEILPYALGDITGEKRYCTVHLCDREYCVRHSVLTATGRSVRRYLSLECRGPTSSGADVDAAFEQILATVRA